MIMRVATRERFTQIPLRILDDSRLTWKARGILCFLLSKPDNWEVNERYLATQSNEGVTAVRSALKELETLGYIIRERKNAPNGQLAWESVIYENPQSQDTPCLGFPSVGKPSVGNHTLTNTDITNIELNHHRQPPAEQMAVVAVPFVLTAETAKGLKPNELLRAFLDAYPEQRDDLAAIVNPPGKKIINKAAYLQDTILRRIRGEEIHLPPPASIPAPEQPRRYKEIK